MRIFQVLQSSSLPLLLVVIRVTQNASSEWQTLNSPRGIGVAHPSTQSKGGVSLLGWVEPYRFMRDDGLPCGGVDILLAD